MGIKIIDSKNSNINSIVKEIGSRGKMDDSKVVFAVEDIIAKVKEYKDAAVLDFTMKFDNVKLDAAKMKVTQLEIDNSLDLVDSKLIDIMKKAKDNIYEFHIAQKGEDVKIKRGENSYISLVSRPLAIVGIYVPAGTAPLPSSVLMNALAAKAAGVKKIVMCTPPNKNGDISPVILAAAKIAGVDEVYKIGGAQAIAALAYGTQTVPRVDKICGPGNIYVNTAKRLVYGQVDIDMFAGPSEILIIADKTANPSFIAADMLSQAEHDRLASAILITDDANIASKVKKEIEKRAKLMPRNEIIESSLENYCAIILIESITKAIELSNEIAPEHLELCTINPQNILKDIKNAGAIFLGNYTPESLGDYYAGANHVLPTSGTARFFSPLNTNDFIKKISVINYSKEDFNDCYKDVSEFALAEELYCHSQAALVRFDEDDISKGKS